MSVPVTPHFAADILTLTDIAINYGVEWDAETSEWKVKLENVTVRGTANVGAGQVTAYEEDLTIPLSDLPPAAATSLTQLYGAVQSRMQQKVESNLLAREADSVDNELPTKRKRK